MALGMAGTESIDLQSWNCIHEWGDMPCLTRESDGLRERSFAFGTVYS